MTPERALSATSKALRACASGVDRATPLASALARPAFRAASAWVAFWLAAFASLVRRVGGAATLDAAVAATRRATMLARAAAPAAPRRRRAKGEEEEEEDDEYRREMRSVLAERDDWILRLTSTIAALRRDLKRERARRNRAAL
jgi:hypothetical protein